MRSRVLRSQMHCSGPLALYHSYGTEFDGLLGYPRGMARVYNLVNARFNVNIENGNSLIG